MIFLGPPDRLYNPFSLLHIGGHMRSVAAVLALTLLSAGMPPSIGQDPDRKPPAAFAGTNFSVMGCGSITTNEWIVRCEGGRDMQFRMRDVKNPPNVTLIKGRTIAYNLSTGEVRAGGNVSITIENKPNKRTASY